MPSGDGYSARTTPVSRRRLPKSSGRYQSLGPVVDGLFLGRFAHDTRALAQVVTEVLASGQSRVASPTSSKEYS